MIACDSERETWGSDDRILEPRVGRKVCVRLRDTGFQSTVVELVPAVTDERGDVLHDLGQVVFENPASYRMHAGIILARPPSCAAFREVCLWRLPSTTVLRRRVRQGLRLGNFRGCCRLPPLWDHHVASRGATDSW